MQAEGRNELERLVGRVEAEMWSEVAGKVKPTTRHDVLCAWQPSYSGGSWSYEVLVHWPDGVWTDTMENEVEADEMPTHWQEIQRPAWKAPNTELNGGCKPSDLSAELGAGG